MTDSLSSGMSKISEYRRGLEFCELNAARAYCREFRQIWRSIADCYMLLIELDPPGCSEQAAPDLRGRAADRMRP